MKRTYVDSDHEEDDGYSTQRCVDGDEDETIARKRRRGLIEKKRRDRINSCLTELRRLVPAAVDKQGSTKLEKAEILQLTVEHLRNLRNITKREPVRSSDVDFRAMGFRECLNEVSSYLHNFQDPSCKNDQKAQLMDHLNTLISHRLSGYPRVCQSRQTASMATPVPWSRTQAVTTKPMHHDKPAMNLAKQQNLQHLNIDTSLTSQSVHAGGMTQVTENGIKPEAAALYPFTLFPACSKMQILGFPFIQQLNLSSGDPVIYSTSIEAIGPGGGGMKADVFCSNTPLHYLQNNRA